MLLQLILIAISNLYLFVLNSKQKKTKEKIVDAAVAVAVVVGFHELKSKTNKTYAFTCLHVCRQAILKLNTSFIFYLNSKPT